MNHTREDVALLRRLLEVSEDRMTNAELDRIERLADWLDYEVDMDERGEPTPNELQSIANAIGGPNAAKDAREPSLVDALNESRPSGPIRPVRVRRGRSGRSSGRVAEG